MNSAQVRLEIKLTEVERLVNDLNEVVYAQQKMIDQLQEHVQRLEGRLDTAGTELPHQRPPHY